MIRETGLSRDVLKNLVHHRLIFYNPCDGNIRARNKLFLTLYKEDNHQMEDIEGLKAEIAFDTRICNDSDNAQDVRDKAARRLKEAQKKIRDAEINFAAGMKTKQQETVRNLQHDLKYFTRLATDFERSTDVREEASVRAKAVDLQLSVLRDTNPNRAPR